MRATKKFYGWPEDAKFLVPDGVREHFDQGIGARGAEAARRSGTLFETVQARSSPSWAKELDRMQHRASSPTAGTSELPAFPADPKGHGRPRSSGQVLNAVAKKIPWLIGGSADLSALHQDHHQRERRRLRGG